VSALEALLVDQAGVISRRQVIGLGLTSTDINRNLRRRHWALVPPGVYVDHTGPLTWHQRARAGVLFSWPAALSHDSAVRAGDGPGCRARDESTIHVAVDRHRSLVAPPGVRRHRMSGFGQRVRWNLGPPRIHYEDALLDIAADSGSDLDALGGLADACGSRRTTAWRLLASLGDRRRLARRGWLDSVLRDIAEGTCSVLEHGYLTRVERPHGLPRGRRQRPAVSARRDIFRDVDYEAYGLIVELDGRAFHESVADRDRDLDRDLDAAVERLETVRIGYGQVFARASATADRVGRILRRRGWPGSPTRCRLCGGSLQPG
jgi:hypothetical protein